MQPQRFDRLTRSLHARRAVIQTLTGLAAGVGLARPASAVAECGAPGSTCDPTDPTFCCSGICKKSKHGKKARCAPAGSAFGCAKQDNACPAGRISVLCPANPGNAEAFCVNDNKGKPLCATQATCVDCRRDTDCVNDFGTLARCIKKCANCKEQGFKSACVVPLVVVAAP